MWCHNQLFKLDPGSLIRDARDYALVNGLVMRSRSLTNDNSVVHLPFTLLPSPFPEKLYQESIDLQPSISKLILGIANDIKYLEDVLEPIAKVDMFTRNLLSINNKVNRNGLSQPIISCINRADYLLDKHHTDAFRIRQVEVNAIASSMSTHSANLSGLQRYIMAKYDLKLPSNARIAENNSLELVSQGIIDAFDAYKKQDAYVLLLEERRSLNFSDQHLTELSVHRRRPDVRFIRKRFIDLNYFVKLGPNNELLVDGKEIALVYYRTGYDPSDYEFDQAWNLRLLIEQSRAIKCPSINFHLSGAKKFQQVLNTSQQLEKFLNTTEAERLTKVFCEFWPLTSDNFETSDACKMLNQDSSRWVLKPQREGGGHNVFGADIESFINSLSNPGERSQYILMEYIDSPREHNWLLLHDDTDDAGQLSNTNQLVSELGVYGSVLAEGTKLISNKAAGFLVRSKKFGTNEGGVATGYAGISSLLLLDESFTEKELKAFYSD